jgi:hypothetical protein
MILIQTQKETTSQFIQRCVDANQKVECYPVNGQPFTITPKLDKPKIVCYICVKNYGVIKKGEVFKRVSPDLWVSDKNHRIYDSVITDSKEYFELELNIV